VSVFVTGDLHGSLGMHRLDSKRFPEGTSLTKDDYLVVAGDFGLVWDFGAEELWWRDWLEARPWTTLFVDGNHENFEALSRLPVEGWHGGLVQRVSPSVIHLLRGQLFDLGGRTLFALGGAASVDRALRVPGESWWPQELPSEQELACARETLDGCGWKVDYVVTHQCASSVIPALYDGAILQGPDPLSDWMEELEHRLVFKAWYFGHHHVDRFVPPDHRCLYEDIVRLGELQEAWDGRG
jgi:hypothetical protein